VNTLSIPLYQSGLTGEPTGNLLVIAPREVGWLSTLNEGIQDRAEGIDTPLILVEDAVLILTSVYPNLIR
jgi:hypothetical protein